MIKFFHKYMKSFVLTLISFFIAFSMLGFGVDVFSPNRGGDYVARINDREISYADLRTFREELENRYKATWGDYYTQLAELTKLDLDKMARENIVSKYLFEEMAIDLDLLLGGKGVMSKIAAMFPKGQFNQYVYSSFLNSRHQTAQMFEQELMQGGGTAQLQEYIEDVAVAPRAEALALYAEDETAFSVEYLEFDPEKLVTKVEEPKEKALKEYYEKNATDYEKEAQKSFKFVSFEPNKMLDSIEILPEDVEMFYADNEKHFTVPDIAKVQVLRISIPKEDNVDKDGADKNSNDKLVEVDSELLKKTAKARAEAALKEASVADADFAKIIKEYAESSDEAVIKQNQAEVVLEKGKSTMGAIEPKVSKAIFKFAKKGLLDLVETDGAFYVVKVNDFTKSYLKTFESVKDEILLKLKQQEAPAQINERAYVAFDEWQASEKSLADYAKEKGLQLQITDGLIKKSDIPAGAFANLSAKVFEAGNETQTIVESGNNLALVEIVEAKDAYVPEYSEVAEQVKKDYIKQESIKLAQELADKAVKSYADKKAQTLSEVAEDIELKVEKDMKATSLKAPFNSDQMSEVILKARQARQAPELSYENAGKYYVFQVSDIVKPELEQVEAEKLAEYTKKATERDAREMFEILLKKIKLNADIEERFN